MYNNIIKPIAATPVLGGEDAKKILVQVEKKPMESAMKKNEGLVKILGKVRNKD